MEVDYLFRGRRREEKGYATNRTRKLVSVFNGTTSWINEKGGA